MQDTAALLHETTRSWQDDQEDLDCSQVISGNNYSINRACPEQKARPCFYFPHRYRVFVLTLSGLMSLYSTRANFNVALVAMVNFTATEAPVNFSDRCPAVQQQNNTPVQNEGGFPWTPSEQSFLLSSFYYGYIVLQLPGGYLAERYSGKLLMGLGIVVPGILNLLMPLMAGYGVTAFGAMRILCGLASGPVYASLMVIWSHWAPKYERTWLVGISLVGGIIGNLASFAMSGFLCNSTFLGGWPSVFYVFGGLSCVWGLFWYILMNDSPTQDSTISHEELDLITQSTDSIVSRKYVRPPWCAMLMSPPVWALWMVFTLDSFGFYIIENDLAVYLSQVLGFNIQKNGVTIALPFICNVVSCVIFSRLADLVRHRGVLSTKSVRIIATAIGEIGPALCLLMIGLFVECDSTGAIALLMAGQFLNAFTTVGAATNCLDIAPMYAGTIVGVGNTFGNIMGFIAPMTTELITGDSPSRSHWRIVFCLTSGIMASGGIVFAIFGKGEELSWAKAKPSDDDDQSETGRIHHIGAVD